MNIVFENPPIGGAADGEWQEFLKSIHAPMPASRYLTSLILVLILVSREATSGGFSRPLGRPPLC